MDLNTVEQQLKKIPPEIKKAFFSTNTAIQIKEIGEQHGLLLDQIDALVQETGLTMIGLKPAQKFVELITKELDIDTNKARSIAEEINNKVLSDIRKSARESSEKKENYSDNDEKKSDNISTLEHVGDFTIEKENEHKADDVTHADKDDILEGIENPKPNKSSYGFTEPLVDHLLTTPVAEPQQKIFRQEEISSKPKPNIDPYKEPIE